MSDIVETFRAANVKSPVVQGSVLGPNGGATYTLKNGKSFTLTAAECRAVGLIRWLGEKPA